MKRTGLTIMELLTVISITALLMAVLLPSLQNSRSRSKAILCASNVRQLTIGFLTYGIENETLPPAFDGTILSPPRGGYPGNAVYDRMGWWWFNFIEGFYTKSNSKHAVVCCPCKRLTNRMLQGDILCGNYGANRSVCKSPVDVLNSREEFVGKPLRSSTIKHPALTLLLADSGYSMITWWHVADEPPYPLSRTIEDTAYVPGLSINRLRKLWPGQEPDAINGRHPDKTVNTGFVDGHVASKKAEELLVERTEVDYRNRSPLWCPK